MGKCDEDALREKYRKALDPVKPVDANALRRLLLLEGLPKDANALCTETFGRCSLRGLVWKALLGIGVIESDEYYNLVRRGPSSDDSRVREDARRTFSKNDDFTTRVPTEKMIRVLNAYVWSCGNKRGVYAQSMSLLAAPFLYVMPEPDAFHCFRVFLQEKVPSYVQRYAGARYGCNLLDQCLRVTHPVLHKLFESHDLNAEVYAFPSISSLGACVQPMSDTVRLWDIQLGFGAHMHVLFTLARLLLSSNSILDSSKRASSAPLITRELEQGLGLDAETVLARGVPLAAELDPQLYHELSLHTVSVPLAKPETSARPDEVQAPLRTDPLTSTLIIHDETRHRDAGSSSPKDETESEEQAPCS